MDTLKGQFLIAMPSMLDFNFSHTVTCMTEDTEDGALGIVINRVIPSLTAGSIFRELKIEYTDATAMMPLHIGGPVHANEIFILHGEPFSWEGCFIEKDRRCGLACRRKERQREMERQIALRKVRFYPEYFRFV